MSNEAAGYFVKDGSSTNMYGPLAASTGESYLPDTINGSVINDWYNKVDGVNIAGDYGLQGFEGPSGTVYPAVDGTYSIVSIDQLDLVCHLDHANGVYW